MNDARFQTIDADIVHDVSEFKLFIWIEAVRSVDIEVLELLQDIKIAA